MAFDDPTLQPNDPTAGESAGAEEQVTPVQSAARTYSDADMAAARRSFETQSQRDWARREAALRTEYEQRNAPRPVADDPWSALDPQYQQAFQRIFEHEWTKRSAPLQEQAEDTAFRNDEAELRSRYPDYAQSRAEVLEFAVQHNISDIEQAYRAWKFDELSKIDVNAIGKAAVAAHIKKKAAQSAGTPSVEGRGGGTPSSKQTFKNREEMDAAAEAMVRAANENSA